MANNLTLTTTLASPPSGSVFATDDVSGVHYPVGKLAFGPDDTATLVTATVGLPVGDAGGSLTVDAPVGTPVFVRLSDGSAAITTLPVSIAATVTIAGAVTNAGTFAVQESGAALTALQLIDNLVLAEDAAHQSGDPGVQMLAVLKATPADTAGTDGDYQPLQMSAGRLWVSADTELPAAAALADDTSNPTAPAVGSFSHVWDGATWDRTPGNTLGVFVQGHVAHDAADAGNPIKIGGIARSAAPTSVTALDRVDASFTRQGRLWVSTLSGTGTDASAANWATTWLFDDSTGVVGAVGLLYNGSALDRPRNNVDATQLASAARTASTNGSDQTNYNGRGVQVILNVTVASGTGGLQVQVQGKDSISGTYYSLNALPTAITATGISIYTIYPSSLTAAAGDIKQVTSQVLPRTWRIAVTAGDGSSYTYSVSAVVLL